MAVNTTDTKLMGRMTPRASIVEAFKPGPGRLSVTNLEGHKPGASRPSLANKLLGMGAVSKFLNRSSSRGTGLQAKKSLWKKLRQEDNPKKIRMMKLKRKIRIALKTSLFLRCWWYRHLRSVETMVISDEGLDFYTKLIKPPVDEEKPKDMLFDVSAFKANRHQKIAQEPRRILTVLPQYRTEQEVHKVMIALRAHKQIANYPVRMQKLIAQYGFLECFDEKRCVVKQGHPPQAFYYIFYGSVDVTVDEGVAKKVVCVLDRGESFGELAIVNDEDRQSSVISKTELELISIKKEIYEEAFMAGGAKKITDPDHEQFLKSLEFLDGWPISMLDINPKLFIFTYFQRGAVMVKDSNFNDWLFVVKSGSIDVLKKLIKSKPTVNKKTGSQKRLPNERERFESFICGQYFQYCQDHRITVPSPLTVAGDNGGRVSSLRSSPMLPLLTHRRKRSLSAPLKQGETEAVMSVARANTNTPDASLPKLMWQNTIGEVKRGLGRKQTLANLVRKHVRVLEESQSEVGDDCSIGSQEFEPPTENPPATQEKRTFVDDLDKGFKKRAHLLTPADRNPQFVKVQTLTKGSNFGLADIILGPQPSFCLISNGAECVMINKEFYKEHCPQSLLRKLLPMVSPYPEEEAMQEDLHTKLNWDAQREAILENTMNHIKQSLIRVNK